MPVLDRTELEASPLADLHAIANELGVDGYRLLRKDELIDAILGGGGLSARDFRSAAERSLEDEDDEGGEEVGTGRAQAGRRPTERATTRRRLSAAERPSGRTRERGSTTAREPRQRSGERGARVAEGEVELRDGGSAFLRVAPPGASDDDVYISPAQVKRCELKTGDRVSGPVRMPRRSERHASLARVETINGVAADEAVQAPSAGAAREGRGRGAPARRGAPEGPGFPSELLAFPADDAALIAVQRLAPVGFGSRAVIVGASRAGKSELLRRVALALAPRSDVEVDLVLVGVRPEEVPEWQSGGVTPSATLTFAASPDTQGQAVERALAKAERRAAAGARAVVLIDTLDGLHPQAARKALASAQNLAGAGSLTVIGTAARPYGGETTVIALDVALASTGQYPALDVMASGTLRPELLVGPDGAQAIMQVRADHERRAARKGRRFWQR
jgi:transcription termination factor Rho